MCNRLELFRRDYLTSRKNITHKFYILKKLATKLLSNPNRRRVIRTNITFVKMEEKIQSKKVENFTIRFFKYLQPKKEIYPAIVIVMISI